MLVRVKAEVRKRFDNLFNILEGETEGVTEDRITARESAQLAYNDLIAAPEVLKENYVRLPLHDA
jgi:hypothetical protein